MGNWKEWVIFKPIVDIYNSLFNNDKGISFRKGYAVIAIIYAYQLQLSILDDKVKEKIIYSWQLVGLLCIGLVTIPDLIKFLSSKKDENPKQ